MDTEARARLAALASDGPIRWPEAAGIAVNEQNEPTVGEGPRPAWVSAIGWLMYDSQPAAGEETGLIRSCYPALTEEQARQGLSYLETHGALFAGRAGREWLENGEFGREREQAEEFLADLRALLAALDERERTVADLTERYDDLLACMRTEVREKWSRTVLTDAEIDEYLDDEYGVGPLPPRGDYRRAAGIAPRRPGEPLPEDAIRALRDGDDAEEAR